MKLEVVVTPVSEHGTRESLLREPRMEAGRHTGRVRRRPAYVLWLGCSVQFGGNRTTAAPGSAQGLWLVVSDLQATLDKMASSGIKVNEVYHIGANDKASGIDPERHSYRSFVSFQDPDGNRWVLQEITTRLPGRIDSSTTSFASASDLESALVRAAKAHGEHEKRIGTRDENWHKWNTEYMVAVQSGKQLPTG